MLPLVPSMIHQLVNSPEWTRADTSSVESTVSGAAFLPPDLCAKYQSKLGPTFFHGYGLSESVRVLRFFSHGSRETHVPANSCRPLGLWERCERISSLDTNQSVHHLVCCCPACRPGSFVRTAWTAVSGSPANFGSKGTVSPEVTSMTNVRLRRHSPRTGGSKREISSPSTRREITSEISGGS